MECSPLITWSDFTLTFSYFTETAVQNPVSDHGYEGCCSVAISAVLVELCSILGLPGLVGIQ
eukprot:3669342-Rhodomonas_salina.1